MSERGVFAVDRGIWTDPDFAAESFTEREAFIWLVSEAAWRKHNARGYHGPVSLERGEFCHSIRFMAEAWGWNKSRVERFLSKLEKRDTIRDTSRDSQKIYSIRNYNKFQVVKLPGRDTSRDEIETLPRHYRDKLEDKENKEDSSDTIVSGEAPLTDSRDILFSKGLEYVSRHFRGDERKARTMIGRWIKDSRNNPGVVLDALRRAQADRVADLLSWMPRAIGPPKKPLSGALAAIQRSLESDAEFGQERANGGGLDAREPSSPSIEDGHQQVLGPSVLRLAHAGQGRRG